MWLGYSSCKHLSARPANRAAAAGSIATPALVSAMAARLVEDRVKRAANTAIRRMRGFLRLMANASNGKEDFSAAGRGAWLGPCMDRPASNAWGIGPSDPFSPRGTRDSK